MFELHLNDDFYLQFIINVNFFSKELCKQVGIFGIILKFQCLQKHLSQIQAWILAEGICVKVIFYRIVILCDYISDDCVIFGILSSENATRGCPS